jgi:hypothetical protein
MNLRICCFGSSLVKRLWSCAKQSLLPPEGHTILDELKCSVCRMTLDNPVVLSCYVRPLAGCRKLFVFFSHSLCPALVLPAMLGSTWQDKSLLSFDALSFGMTFVFLQSCVMCDVKGLLQWAVFLT